MPDPQQYTEAQLSDGRTLRFMGQLGPDEVKQKVHAFRTREGAQNIEANPPGIPRPSGPDMQPSLWGDVKSMGPDAVTQGREAAGRAFPGIHGPTKYDSRGMPAYQKPTKSEDASGAATVGATLMTPFTGGQSLLTRMGLMGAGAGLGSAGDQLLESGEVDPNQTAGDVANWGTSELAGSTISSGIRNAGKLARIGGSALLHTPFVGAPVRAGLRQAVQEFEPAAPMWRDFTRQNVPYAGEIDEGGSEALTISRPRLIQRMGGKPVEEITAKPSGRTVLSPEEFKSRDQQMSLAKKMASQRGMQYAAGMRPED